MARFDSQEHAPLPTEPGQVPAFFMGGWLVLPDQNRLIGSPDPTSPPPRPARSTDPTTDAGIQIEPRIMHVLVCLAARPGCVLSRRELIDTVWQDVVVREEALTHAVSQLRRVLGDSSRSALAIETIRKGGYRLLLPVSPIDHRDDSGRPATRPTTDRGRPRVVRFSGAILLGALALPLIAWMVWGSDRNRTGSLDLTAQARPVTSLEGSEIFPALSPDGTLLAFSHAARGTDHYDLYVTPVAGGDIRPLTSQPGLETHATWSPSGETLAFFRHHDGRHGVFSVPAIGGQEKTLLTDCAGLHGMDWSPSGEALCVGLRRPDDQGRSQFILCEVSLPGLGLHPLTTPPPHQDDVTPAYGPRGERLAFVRLDHAGLAAVHLLDRESGQVRSIGPRELSIQGLTWLPDGHTLVYGCLEAGRFVLKRLHLAGGHVELFMAQQDWLFFPRSARRANALVYEEKQLARDIVAMDLETDDSSNGNAIARDFLDSTQPDFAPRFSPSGSRVAFLSLRSGRLAFWLCQASGGQARELCSPPGLTGRRYAWSPDGRQLASTVLEAGVLRICLVDTRTGAFRLLDNAGAMLFRSWSADGDAIMGLVERDGELRSVRYDLATGQLTHLEPPTARVLGDTAAGTFYCLPGDDRVWLLPPGGDAADAHALALPPGVRTSSLICRQGRLYFARSGGEETTFCSLCPASGQHHEIATVSGLTGPHIDLSPDGRMLLYERTEVLQVDVMMLPAVP